MQLQQPAALFVVPACQKPALELRPASDQRLVREVDEPLAGRGRVRRQHAAIYQSIDDLVDLHGILSGAGQRGARLLAPGIGPALTEADQAQQDPASEQLLRRREVVEDRVGAARERNGEAAASVAAELLVAREAQESMAAPGPQQHQRLLEQRQRPRFGRGVGHQLLDERLLEIDAGLPCGSLDRRAQRISAQRRDLQSRELAVDVGPQFARHQRAVEIGAQRDDQMTASVCAEHAQHTKELAPLLGAGEREQLLELVEEDEQSIAVLSFEQTVRRARQAFQIADAGVGQSLRRMLAGTKAAHSEAESAEPGIGGLQAQDDAGGDQR